MIPNIIIADDEASIRRGLCDIVPWSKLGYNLCGIFSNGQEVLNFLQKSEKTVHIIFLDLNMPLINGKELIHLIKNKYPELITIAVTSSNQLEDIKMTFMNGARDYLHKPALNEKIIIDTLYKHMPTPKLLAYKNEHEEVIELKANYPTNGYHFYYAIFLDSIDFFQIHEVEESLKKITKKISCSYQVEKRQNATIFLINSLQTIELLTYLPNEQPLIYTNASNTFDTIQQTLVKIFNSYDDFNFYLSSFPLCWDPEWNFRTSSFIEKKQSFYDQINQPSDCNELLSFLETEILSHQLFMSPKNDLISFFTNNCINFLNQIETKKNQSFSIEKLKIMKKIALAQTYMELVEIITNFIKQYQLTALSNSTSIKNEIKHYINQNYQRSIDLSTVSEKFNFSYNYFSNLFISLFNQKFTDYLTNVRIREAKKLLLETKYSVAEIGNLVGYSDTAYFSKVFKKNTDISPNTYRKKNYE